MKRGVSDEDARNSLDDSDSELADDFEIQFSRRGLLQVAGRTGLMTALGGGAVLSALQSDHAGAAIWAANAPEHEAAVPPKHVTISTIGWGGGQDPSWVRPLQKALNITITYKGVGSMVDLQNLVVSSPPGTYDCAGIYNHQATPVLYARKKLVPLQLTRKDFNGLLPFFRPSASRLRGPDIIDGKIYYATANADYQGMMFNKESVPLSDLRRHGYDILYQPKYKGKIAVWDDAVQTMPIFAFMLGYNPFLLTNAQFARVKAKMMALAPQVFMVPSYGEGITAMSDGSAVLLGSMNGSAGLAPVLKQGIPAAVYYDKRGVLVPTEGASVIAGTKNPERAQAFVKAWLDPRVQVNMMIKASWASPPTAVAAWKLIPSFYVQKSMQFRLDRKSGKVVPKIGDPNWRLVNWINPIRPSIADWTAAWNEFKRAIR